MLSSDLVLPREEDLVQISCTSPPKKAQQQNWFLAEGCTSSSRDLLPRKLLRSCTCRISHRALAQRSCTTPLEQDIGSLAGLVPLLWELLCLGSLARILVDSIFFLRHLSTWNLLSCSFPSTCFLLAHSVLRYLKSLKLHNRICFNETWRNRNIFKFRWSFKSISETWTPVLGLFILHSTVNTGAMRPTAPKVPNTHVQCAMCFKYL